MAKTPRPNAPQNQSPAGTIIAFSGSTSSFTSETSDGTTFLHKDGWALCNGASISQATFTQLWARLSTTWNTAANPLTGSAQSAPNSGYFRIPNLQGTFLRGVGDFTDNTKDTTLAGYQADQFKKHVHAMSLAQDNTPDFGGPSEYGLGVKQADAYVDNINTDRVTSGPGGTESRPQNIGVYYLVKLYDLYV